MLYLSPFVQSLLFPDGIVMLPQDQYDQYLRQSTPISISTPTPLATPSPSLSSAGGAVASSDSFVPTAQQQLGGGLFNILCGVENCVFSPYSIYNVLGMILLGAGGNTEAQLFDVMNVPQSTLNGAQLHAAIGEVKNGLLSPAVDEALIVKLADNIFTSGRISDVYTNNLEQYYSVQGPVQVDFSSSQLAADIINQYVSDATEGEITDLIPASVLNTDTLAVLINAVYFKADWLTPFDTFLTENAVFNSLSGKQVGVNMMGLEFEFRYSIEDDMKVIELPYVGEEFFMYVVVPDPAQFDEIRADIITSKDIISFLEQKLQPISDVEVRLPRFSFKDKTDLKDLLVQLGVVDLFVDGVSDLSGMVAEGERVPYISEAIHEAKIEVAELGTVAAAATGAVIQVESVGIQKPLFVADSPFIYILLHKPTNTILFMGQLIDPSVEQ